MDNGAALGETPTTLDVWEDSMPWLDALTLAVSLYWLCHALGRALGRAGVA